MSEDDEAGPEVGHQDGPPPPGLEQFQKAALEAVRAARAMLDAAEAIVQDPKAIEVVVSTVTGLARDAAQSVAGFAAGAPGGGPQSDDDSGGGFESIDVD